MNSKTLKRQRELKNKLMAAISMLLVSSIMLVTSTYAWFTLSTAPEVTGITTAVGANGNLEMALQPYNGDSNSIKSEQGDSVKVDALRNITWGNLVNLEDNDTYGLNMITLYPSQLNLAVTATENNPAKIAVNPLSTPEYGADGRVSNLVSKTIMGVFNNGEFNEELAVTQNGVAATLNDAKGVRAIGIASGMSARQLAYRSAISTASTADGSAKQMASNSLNNYGDDLASMAMDYALASDKDAKLFDQDDVNIMITVVNELLGYDKAEGGAHVTGALEYIESALKNYILANSLATASDNEYQSISEAINSATLDTMSSVSEAVIPDEITTYIDTLYADNTGVITKVKAAKAALSDLSGESYTWSQISTPLNYLINTDEMTINGMTVNEAQADKNALINTIIESQLQIKVELKSGAGVYADIADFCGDYTAGIMLNDIEYESYGPWDLPATMVTKTSAAPVYLTVASGEVTPYTDGGAEASSNPISEFYGYIIDLAFRTNAANSWLQLQSTGVDRIYKEGSSNPDTMGGGATMTFSTPSSAFNDTQVKSLMEKIRVVLFDTDSKDVIGYARLDASKIQSSSAGEYTMPLMLTDADGNAIIDDNTTTTVNESIAIMELTQNQVHELSVMVYLDGTTMTNADVASDEAKSLVGSMNLQFSSSATLVPMEYNDLKTEGGSTSNSNTALTNVTVTEGYSAQAYTDGNNVGFTLTPPTGTSLDGANVTITIATGEGTTEALTATSVDMGEVTGYVVKIPSGVTVTADTAITIAVSPATP